MGGALTQAASQPSSSVDASSQAVPVGSTSALALSKADITTAFSSGSTAVSWLEEEGRGGGRGEGEGGGGGGGGKKEKGEALLISMYAVLH